MLWAISQNTPLYWPYMYHYVTSTLGFAGAEFGVLKAIYYFTVVLCEVPFGVVADRLGRRVALLGGAVANVAACAMYATATGFEVLIGAEMIFGVGTALASGAGSALLFDSLAGEDRGAEYARCEGRVRSAGLISTTLALPLTDLLLIRGDDATLAYLATTALSAIGVGAALAIAEPQRATRATAREIGLGALGDALRTPAIRRVIAYGAGVFVLMRAGNALLFDPVLAAGGVPVGWFGSTMAALGLVGAVTAWQTGAASARFGTRRVSIVLPAVCVAMYAALACVSTPWVAAILCLNGIAVGALPVVVLARLQPLVTSSDRRATLLSIESMVSRAAYGGGSIAIGAALDRLPLTEVLAWVALAGCIPLALACRRTSGDD